MLCAYSSQCFMDNVLPCMQSAVKPQWTPDLFSIDAVQTTRANSKKRLAPNILMKLHQGRTSRVNRSTMNTRSKTTAFGAQSLCWVVSGPQQTLRFSYVSHRTLILSVPFSNRLFPTLSTQTYNKQHNFPRRHINTISLQQLSDSHTIRYVKNPRIFSQRAIIQHKFTTTTWATSANGSAITARIDKMKDGSTMATSAKIANIGNARNVRKRGVISGGIRLGIMVLCMDMQLGP